MLASQVRSGTMLGGVRVDRTSSVTMNRRRMVRLHLADGTTRECVPGAELVVTHSRRLELDAGVVRAPRRTEIVPAVQESQTPRGNGRRGVSTTRRPS